MTIVKNIPSSEASRILFGCDPPEIGRLIDSDSGVATGSPDSRSPPTKVQTPLEICAKLLNVEKFF